MHARPTHLLATLLVAVGSGLVASCGDDTPDRARLTEELMEESGGSLDEEQAGCVARGLEEAFGEDSYQQVIDVAVGEAHDEEVRTQVIDIFAGCEALGAVVLDDP